MSYHETCNGESQQPHNIIHRPDTADRPIDLVAGFYPGGRETKSLAGGLLGDEDIRFDILYQMSSILWNGIEVRETIPAGAHLYLCNHQCTYDIGLFALLLGLLNGQNTRILAWNAHDRTQGGTLLKRLFEHPSSLRDGVSEKFDIQLIDPYARDKLLGDFQLVSDNFDSLSPRSICAVASGWLDLSEDERINTLSSVFLTLATEQRVNIYPVRFMWAKTGQKVRAKSALPEGLTPQRATIGRAVTPQMLDGLNLLQQRNLVLDALNQLGVPCPTEIQNQNRERNNRVNYISSVFGTAKARIVLCDALITANLAELSKEGQTLRRFITDTSSHISADHNSWLWEFALWLTEGFVMTTPDFLNHVYGCESFNPPKSSAN